VNKREGERGRERESEKEVKGSMIEQAANTGAMEKARQQPSKGTGKVHLDLEKKIEKRERGREREKEREREREKGMKNENGERRALGDFILSLSITSALSLSLSQSHTSLFFMTGEEKRGDKEKEADYGP
jgi:hypothetical protein